MRIAILTPGRFHVLDLARELHTLGHDVCFYSYVPQRRSARFGLPKACARSGFWIMFPFYLLRTLLTRFGTAYRARENHFYFQNLVYRFLVRFNLEQWSEDVLRNVWDRVACAMLEPCDVVIAISGFFDRCFVKAKSHWNALILVECGTRHILSRKEILDAVKVAYPMALTVPFENVSRELKDYGRADRIVVSSKQVVESFVQKGIDESRLFRNPYGVDLSMFRPTQRPKGPPTLLMVGSWSYQKGCDLLEQAMEGMDCRLLHAGSVVDYPFPSGDRYHSLGRLDQADLNQVYAQAHVFVLPSRQEGLALVQAQALACGLPVVCSDRTGGADLRDLLDDPSRVIVVKSGEVEALRAGILKAFHWVFSEKENRGLSLRSLERLSWQAYGRRYDQFLRTLFSTART